jgi:hypothetical protein
MILVQVSAPVCLPWRKTCWRSTWGWMLLLHLWLLHLLLLQVLLLLLLLHKCMLLLLSTERLLLLLLWI